jgi:hypothetical protein
LMECLKGRPEALWSKLGKKVKPFQFQRQLAVADDQKWRDLELTGWIAYTTLE